jgi:hypothetical protein
MKDYTRQELASQPIGYWSGEAYRTIVGRIRADLAMEGLTQPHWWVLNHVAASPGIWTPATLTERLRSFDDQGTDFAQVFTDLSARGWLKQDGETLTLTADGESGRLRAAARGAEANELTHEGISPAEYVACLNVLRRMIDNLGGNSDLP